MTKAGVKALRGGDASSWGNGGRENKRGFRSPFIVMMAIGGCIHLFINQCLIQILTSAGEIADLFGKRPEKWLSGDGYQLRPIGE